MKTEMETNGPPRPPVVGIVYGNIAYWLALVGVLITIIGSVIYLLSGGYFDKASLLENLWKGGDVSAIWKESTGVSVVPHGYWYLGGLVHGDCIAMLGIAVACAAGVIGMWGVLFSLLHGKRNIYIIFALMVAVILTLSASGIITVPG